MSSLLALYRRLDLLQRRRNFRLGATALVLLVCGGVFGALLLESHREDVQRRALLDVLSTMSLEERDEPAVTLSQRGELTVDGKTYGGEKYLRNAAYLFDEGGKIRFPAALAERMLSDVRPSWAPRWMLEQPSTAWMLALFTTAWLLAVIWLNISVPFVLTLLGTGVFVGAARLAGSAQAMLAFGGIGLLTFTYLLLTRVVLLALDRPRQALAVAHTVVKEASRSRLSLVFIVVLLVVLPLIPIWLDPQAPLRYQLQTFMSRSLTLTYVLAACLTLVLSCATVAFEIRDRQIWQLMTKPMNRFSYLLGKWLGVACVNLVLLTVAGVSIFTFVQYLRERPVASGLEGQMDSLAVQSEVLTARRARWPNYQRLDSEQVTARVNQIIEARPDLGRPDDVPLSVIREIQGEIQQAFDAGQRTVPPQAGRDYVFSGLDAARDRGEPLTLRYRFHILRSDPHETYPAVFFFNRNSQLAVRRTYVPTMSHVLPIPAELIREDGTLVITIFNGYEPSIARRDLGSLNFEREDFELLYIVGNFEANFLRAVLITWVKLSFLAILGVCCSTFLSFSVACLLSFTVFIAGTLGPYLADALTIWYPPPTSSMDWSNIGLVVRWAFQWFIKGVAEIVVWSLRGFGELSATQRLVEGKFIGWGEVASGVFKLGIVWSGVSLVIGYLVIKSRQLAIYSGQG